MFPESSSLKYQQIESHRLANGMTVVGELMPWLESAAFSFSVPAGCQYDPPQKAGLANFVCEMVQRGCGTLNSREFIEKLEAYGVPGPRHVIPETIELLLSCHEGRTDGNEQ